MNLDADLTITAQSATNHADRIFSCQVMFPRSSSARADCRSGVRAPPMRNLSFVIAFALAQISLASAQDKSIVVASTTSTQDSGLYGFILPLFKQKTGIDVIVVALGTGQALDMARRGGADVVFVHAREAEEKFIAQGFGVKRYSVMYNDFVIIGPKDDPASIRGSRNVRFALQTIKAKGAPFISRGDNSGTHT